MDSSSTSTATVQHVTKKSSDELLRKFAQVGSDSAGKELVRLPKRRKRSSRTRRESEYFCESPLNNGGGGGGGSSLVERKWLLPPATRRSALLRQLGIGRSHLRSARDFNSRSLFGTIEKTWRRTVQGASRVFMEKHYNRHRPLINDVV